MTAPSPPLPTVATVKDRPSGEKAIETTLLPDASNVCFSSPVCASQSFTVPSLLPLASIVPSGENTVELISLLWPVNVWRKRFVDGGAFSNGVVCVDEVDCPMLGADGDEGRFPLLITNT